MEHFPSISSDLLGAQGFPREVVVEHAVILSRKSGISIKLRSLRSSSVGKDARSTVTRRIELSSLVVIVLRLTVVSSVWVG